LRTQDASLVEPSLDAPSAASGDVGMPAGDAAAPGIDAPAPGPDASGPTSDAGLPDLGGSPDGTAAAFDGSAGPDADGVACAIHGGEIPPSVYRPRMDGATGLPKRLVVFYTPLGTILPSWRPSLDFTLSPILAPLQRHKAKMVVIDGIDNVIAPGVPSTTDASGASVLLTGHPGVAASLTGTPFRCGGATSLDVALGQPALAFPTVRLGVGVVVASPLTGPLLPSFVDSGRALLPEVDPRAAGARLQVAVSVPPGDPLAEVNLPKIMKSQIDIAVHALATDKTRSVMLSFGTPASRTRFQWLGISQAYADVAAASGNPGGPANFIKIQNWYAEQLAYLATLLDSIPEGAGTLLDQTLVVWLSETGEASSGTGKSIPVVLLGGAGVGLTTGRYVRVTAGTTQADLLYTIAGLFGVTGFGDPSLNPRRLPGL
jgi:hypothetical protein